jgi:hypothetical protein
MPRYFFHLYDDLVTTDEEGIELPNLIEAEAFGLENARILAAEEVKRGRLNLKHRLEIADESGVVFRRIPFAGAFELVS